MDLSFKNKYELLKKINELPHGPDFTRWTTTITGDLRDPNGELMTEDVELLYRDPEDCVRELLSNSCFRDHIVYAPRKV